MARDLIAAMLDLLWGLKTHAIFDVWTFEHILSGISVGAAVSVRNHKELKKILQRDHDTHSWYFNVLGVLFAAYLWETIEHYLESGLAGAQVEYWFQGVEFWANRIIADPLMLVFGYYIARSIPWFVMPARILSVIWILVHIFFFPHSMYLHDIL